jgi:hypothetical protein
MIVPKFWAEARAQHREPGRQVTVRRFGWSDVSETEAQAHAQARVAEALQRILAGESLKRRDPKVPYNGADGVPIREEIVRQYGNVVITRNSYGAWCLNTPDVLFADVDFARQAPIQLGFAVSFLLFLGAIWVMHESGFGWHWVGMAIIALLVGFILAEFLSRAFVRLAGGAEKRDLRRIKSFSAKHPNWRLRVYRTPAGFRVLAMHRTFSPSEPEVAEFFRALGTDPMYVQMCVKQQCFRARVTPKPWRIGIAAHLKPRPGVWPVRPEALPARQEWVRVYEAKAANYASCHFVMDLGIGDVHDTPRVVQRIHDELCRVESGLPIA